MDPLTEPTLCGLAESGIQAINLDPVDARFDLKDGSNRLQGEARKVGVYVGDDKTVKTTQQVDLAV